jgi:hypothetical protein
VTEYSRHCHPKGSKAASGANRLAESKDPELAGASATWQGVFAAFSVNWILWKKLPDGFGGMLRGKGSFDCARSFERASLRMTE